MVLLQKYGMPWHLTKDWSPARRMAALIVIGESNGGHFDYIQWKMQWPEGRS